MTPTFMVLSWTLAKLLIESTTPFFFKNYFSVTYLLSSPELSCLGIPISVFACHGIKSIPQNFLYLMVCDRVESSLPSCLLFILMTLLAELEELGVGCFWNNHFLGAVCYANDIALLAPSPAGLQMMLDTYSSFASSHSLMFDASKTQLVRFSRLCPSAPHFLFNGLKLYLSQSAKHLGHILSYNLSDSEDIIRVKKDLVRKANFICSTSSLPAAPWLRLNFLAESVSLYTVRLFGFLLLLN